MVANSMSQQHNAPPKQVTQSLVTSMTVFPYKGHQIPRLGLGYGVHSGQHVFTRRLRNEFPSVKKKNKIFRNLPARAQRDKGSYRTFILVKLANVSSFLLLKNYA